MDRFPRFRRSKKDAATATPVHEHDSDLQISAATTPSTTNANSATRMTTTPPTTAHHPGGGGHNLEPPNMQSKSKPQQLRKLSPFSRGFHLRSSHKRSRDSPPASLPQSPTAAAAGERPRTAVAQGDEAVRENGHDVGAGRPKMPAFLELGEKGMLSSTTCTGI